MRCSVFTMYRRALKHLNDNEIIGKSMQNFTRDRTRIFTVRTRASVNVLFIQSYSYSYVQEPAACTVPSVISENCIGEKDVILISHCLLWKVWRDTLHWVKTSMTALPVWEVFLCFFVFFQGILQMLIYVLLHFICVCILNTCFTSNLSGRFGVFLWNHRKMRR